MTAASATSNQPGRHRPATDVGDPYSTGHPARNPARQSAPATDRHARRCLCAVHGWRHDARGLGPGTRGHGIWGSDRVSPRGWRPLAGGLRAGSTGGAAADTAWRRPLVAGLRGAGAALLSACPQLMAPSGCQSVNTRPVRTATKTMSVLRYRILLEAAQSRSSCDQGHHFATGGGSVAAFLRSRGTRQRQALRLVPALSRHARARAMPGYRAWGN